MEFDFLRVIIESFGPDLSIVAIVILSGWFMMRHWLMHEDRADERQTKVFREMLGSIGAATNSIAIQTEQMRLAVEGTNRVGLEMTTQVKGVGDKLDAFKRDTGTKINTLDESIREMVSSLQAVASNVRDIHGQSTQIITSLVEAEKCLLEILEHTRPKDSPSDSPGAPSEKPKEDPALVLTAPEAAINEQKKTV